ncbi:MAG: PCRF domain-containing protein, partial [Oscillospiraceae bacterium]|nr:PCRF domain-containing protein [Oscillospiraceae bacterium]
MLNKLREIDNRFTELEDMLQSPEVYSDPERYAKLAREQKELRPISEAYCRMVSLQNELSSAKELLSDPELGEMARAVITESKAKLEETETEIKLL